jgi:hypothetical protein
MYIYSEQILDPIFDSLKDTIIDWAQTEPAPDLPPWNKGLPKELQPRFNTIYQKTSIKTKRLKSKLHKEFPRIWMTNILGNAYHVLKSNTTEYLEQGWIFGRGKLQRKKKQMVCLYASCIICRKHLQVNNLSNHYKKH